MKRKSLTLVMKKNRLISLIMISFLGCSLAACGGQEKHSKTRLDRSTAQKYESTIAGGMTTTVGLKTDGTVVAVGQNEYGQCDVSEWTDIVAVAAGDFHTVQPPFVHHTGDHLTVLLQGQRHTGRGFRQSAGSDLVHRQHPDGDQKRVLRHDLRQWLLRHPICRKH